MTDVLWRSHLLDDEGLEPPEYNLNPQKVSTAMKHEADTFRIVLQLRDSGIVFGENFKLFDISLESWFSAGFLAWISVRWIRGGFCHPSLMWSLAGLIVWPFTLYNLGVISAFLSF